MDYSISFREGMVVKAPQVSSNPLTIIKLGKAGCQ